MILKFLLIGIVFIYTSSHILQIYTTHQSGSLKVDILMICGSHRFICINIFSSGSIGPPERLILAITLRSTYFLYFHCTVLHTQIQLLSFYNHFAVSTKLLGSRSPFKNISRSVPDSFVRGRTSISSFNKHLYCSGTV